MKNPKGSQQFLLLDNSVLSQEHLSVLNGRKQEIPAMEDWHIEKNIDENGTLFIPITGVLDTWDYPMSITGWLTTYNFLHSRIKEAYTNESIKAVVFNVNSPGGHSMNCRSIAEEIELLSQKKPCQAIVNGYCCSGAFMLVAKIPISATQGSMIGSIGVLGRLVDDSKYFEDMGITFHNISMPDGKKINGTGQALTDEDIERYRNSSIAGIFNDIKSMVSPRVTEEKITELNAATYTSEDALRLGLIDGIITAEQMIMKELPIQGGHTMSKEENKDKIPSAESSAETITMSKDELKTMIANAVSEQMQSVDQKKTPLIQGKNTMSTEDNKDKIPSTESSTKTITMSKDELHTIVKDAVDSTVKSLVEQSTAGLNVGGGFKNMSESNPDSTSQTEQETAEKSKEEAKSNLEDFAKSLVNPNSTK